MCVSRDVHDECIESHMRHLSRREVLARRREREAADGAVMSALVEESLRVVHEVTHDDRRSERVDEVLIVRVENEAVRHVAVEADHTGEV